MIDPATIEQQLHDRSRRIIRTDGTIEPVDKPMPVGAIEKMIGAATADTTMLRHLGHPRIVMAVDDNGYETRAEQHGNVTELVPVRARKPVNEIATALYLANCTPGTTHQIVGDVYICPDDDYA